MDLFPNGGFVRLRNRARDEYVHADEDACGVSLRPLGATPSVNAVWKVDFRPVEGGGNFVLLLLLLQGAAYGRYLSVMNLDALSGHRGRCVIQRDYTLEYLLPFLMWAPLRVEAGQNYVRLHNDDQSCLRANGRYCRWNNLVTVDVRTESTMMQWSVEPIQSTLDPLPLPPPPPQPPVPRRGLFRRRTGHNVHQHPGRTIWIVRLDDDGNPVTDDWPEFVSNDNSVSNLRTQVAQFEDCENITLGVRAGMNAHVIPLVTDLPNNEDPMQIIVFTTGSRAAAALRYPQF